MAFLRDFEKSGIHLPPNLRNHFVSLSDDIITLGRKFLLQASSDTPLSAPPSTFQLEDLTGLPTDVLESLYRRKRWGRKGVTVAPGGWEAQMMITYAEKECVRQEALTKSLWEDPKRVGVLDTLMVKRAELASLLGKESYAQWMLEDKMVKNQGMWNSALAHNTLI